MNTAEKLLLLFGDSYPGGLPYDTQFLDQFNTGDSFIHSSDLDTTLVPDAVVEGQGVKRHFSDPLGLIYQGPEVAGYGMADDAVNSGVLDFTAYCWVDYDGSGAHNFQRYDSLTDFLSLQYKINGTVTLVEKASNVTTELDENVGVMSSGEQYLYEFTCAGQEATVKLVWASDAATMADLTGTISASLTATDNRLYGWGASTGYMATHAYGARAAGLVVLGGSGTGTANLYYTKADDSVLPMSPFGGSYFAFHAFPGNDNSTYLGPQADASGALGAPWAKIAIGDIQPYLYGANTTLSDGVSGDDLIALAGNRSQYGQYFVGNGKLDPALEVAEFTALGARLNVYSVACVYTAIGYALPGKSTHQVMNTSGAYETRRGDLSGPDWSDETDRTNAPIHGETFGHDESFSVDCDWTPDGSFSAAQFRLRYLNDNNRLHLLNAGDHKLYLYQNVAGAGNVLKGTASGVFTAATTTKLRSVIEDNVLHIYNRDTGALLIGPVDVDGVLSAYDGQVYFTGTSIITLVVTHPLDLRMAVDRLIYPAWTDETQHPDEVVVIARSIDISSVYTNVQFFYVDSVNMVLTRVYTDGSIKFWTAVSNVWTPKILGAAGTASTGDDIKTVVWEDGSVWYAAVFVNGVQVGSNTDITSAIVLLNGRTVALIGSGPFDSLEIYPLRPALS